MTENKSKTSKKDLKRTRGCDAVNTTSPPSFEQTTESAYQDADEAPAAKRTALTPISSNSAKRLSAPFRAPGSTATSVSTRDRAQDTSSDDNIIAAPLPTPVKTPSFNPPPTPIKTPSLNYTPYKPPRFVNAPFVPPKLKNASAGHASSSKPKLTPRESSLTERRDLLKRALRLTKEDDDIRALITKWRSVGREVANDLCKLIEDSGLAVNNPEPKENRQSGFGGSDSSWGLGPRIQSRYDKPWGWLDADTKPESGWGWGTVNEHLVGGKGQEGTGEEVPEYVEIVEEEEVELPSAERIKKELEDALNKPYKKRTSLLPLGGSDAFFEATRNLREAEEAENLAIREKIQAIEKEVETKAWGIGRMLKELGIPYSMFGWDDDAEDWKEDE